MVGVNEEVIISYKEDLAHLEVQRHEQIETMQKRPVITQDRINKMNELWDILTLLSNAAEIIFEDEPEIRALFDLPRFKSNSTSEINEQTNTNHTPHSGVDEASSPEESSSLDASSNIYTDADELQEHATE